ncbi:MAG: hypothetical protein ACLTZB_08330 [Streptococcus salivarius]
MKKDKHKITVAQIAPKTSPLIPHSLRLSLRENEGLFKHWQMIAMNQEKSFIAQLTVSRNHSLSV